MNIKPELLIQLIMTVIAIVSAYYAGKAARHKDKESKETRPQIARLDGFGKHFHIIVTNNKPYNITIQEVVVKEKLFGPIYFKSVPLTWSPSTDVKQAYEDPLRDALAHFNAMPQYVVTTQRTINVELLKHIEGTTYKVFIATTGGRCQSIYRSLLKRPGG